MKVKGLTLISEFLNGAIQGINKLINLVNMIPGVSIQAIDKVNLFAGAKAQAAADKAEREKKLNLLWKWLIKTLKLEKAAYKQGP